MSDIDWSVHRVGSGQFVVSPKGPSARIEFGQADWAFSITCVRSRAKLLILQDRAGGSATPFGRRLAPQPGKPFDHEGLDFSIGRVRLSRGDSVLLRNTANKTAMLTYQGNQVDRFAGEIRYLPIAGDRPNEGGVGELTRAVDEAIAALAAVQPSDEEPAGFGHNNPPTDQGLTREDYEAVQRTLEELRARSEGARYDPEFLERALDTLNDASMKIDAWAARALASMANGFLEGVGQLTAFVVLGVGAYLVLGGKLNNVGAAIKAIMSISGLP